MLTFCANFRWHSSHSYSLIPLWSFMWWRRACLVFIPVRQKAQHSQSITPTFRAELRLMLSTNSSIWYLLRVHSSTFLTVYVALHHYYFISRKKALENIWVITDRETKQQGQAEITHPWRCQIYYCLSLKYQLRFVQVITQEIKKVEVTLTLKALTERNYCIF